MDIKLNTKKGYGTSLDLVIKFSNGEQTWDLVAYTKERQFHVDDKNTTMFFDILDNCLDFNRLDSVEKAKWLVEKLRLNVTEKEQLRDELYPEVKCKECGAVTDRPFNEHTCCEECDKKYMEYMNSKD